MLQFKPTMISKDVGVSKVNVSNCSIIDFGCTGGGQNNGNTKEFRNRICVDYTECTSSVCLHSVVLLSVY
jgi:hypothetical protein